VNRGNSDKYSLIIATLIVGGITCMVCIGVTVRLAKNRLVGLYSCMILSMHALMKLLKLLSFSPVTV